MPGIVTGVRDLRLSRGFWIQDPNADDDPATSEGIFVFTGAQTPTVAVGDAVTVSGTVSEYVPGGTAAGNQSLTQITKPTVTVVSAGNALPGRRSRRRRLRARARTPRPATRRTAAASNALPLQPRTYALDYYESLEGMHVRVGTSRVVGADRPRTPSCG